MRAVSGGLLALCFVCSTGVQADGNSQLDNWSLYGQNALHLEQYDSFGDDSASPYSFTGVQAFDELNVMANRQFSAYNNLNIQAFGVANQSDYRSNDSGFILERAKLNWENGDVGVPFRLEVGDFFAQQTYRTLQRSLKGVQLELQPRFSSATRNSIQLFMGLADPVYRRLDDDPDTYAGGSWLLENDRVGALSLTSVYNYRNNTTARPSLPSREQWVNSIAWARDFTFGTQNLQADSELAYFSGDVTVNNAIAPKHDVGIYAQVNGWGTKLPYDYRFRFERYGQYFQPAGAAIVPNRRTIEGYAGWRFQSGLQVRARAQTFRNNLESANYSDTDVLGINLTGPFIASDDSMIIGQLDAYLQRIADQGDTTNSHIYSVNANLEIPVSDALSVRPGIFFNHANDHIHGNVVIRRQLSIPLDYRFSVGSVSGTISPGVVYNDFSGNHNGSNQVAPSISMTLSGGPHSLSLSHNVLLVNTDLQSGTDSTTQQSSLRYTYSKGRNQISLEAYYFGRNPVPGANTNAYKLGLTWTYSYDKPVSTAPISTPTAGYSPSRPSHTITVQGGELRMQDLAPGIPVETLDSLATVAGLSKPFKQGNMLIYETPFYKEIQRRQRLAFVVDGGTLQKTIVVIDFMNTGDIDTMAQTYSRLRDILYQRLGTPDVQLDKGAFSHTIAGDMVAGKFKRLDEWKMPDGLLRFGIPARTDGQVRIEVIYAKSFPPYSDNHWGEEDLR